MKLSDLKIEPTAEHKDAAKWLIDEMVAYNQSSRIVGTRRNEASLLRQDVVQMLVARLVAEREFYQAAEQVQAAKIPHVNTHVDYLQAQLRDARALAEGRQKNFLILADELAKKKRECDGLSDKLSASEAECMTLALTLSDANRRFKGLSDVVRDFIVGLDKVFAPAVHKSEG